MLTIHNIGYPGVFGADAMKYWGLSGELYQPDIFEAHGQINMLKGGIHFADAITTVSPTHARELLDPKGGMGLAPYLNNRRGDLSGILNGVDYDDWNPETDRFIPANYSVDDMGGKAICKAALQEKFGLDFAPRVPLFGIVSRFAAQKGFDLLREALPRRHRKHGDATGGSGNRRIRNRRIISRSDAALSGTRRQLYWFFGRRISFDRSGQRLFPDAVFIRTVRFKSIVFDALRHLAHRARDRRFGRHCSQLRRSHGRGGRASNSGITSASALYYCMGWAVSTWYDRPAHIQQLRRQAMAQEFLWSDSAREYEKRLSTRHPQSPQRRGLIFSHWRFPSPALAELRHPLPEGEGNWANTLV